MKEFDRRYIFLMVFLALLLPMVFKFSLPAVRMSSAEQAYKVVDEIQFKPGEVAFVALDFGPSTMAENRPQTEIFLEHLMRKRIPFLLFSQYYLAPPFLKSIPQSVAGRLMKEYPSEKWEYGKDWVNLGYRPSGGIFIQGIPKSENLVEYFVSDDLGNELKNLPLTRELKNFSQIKMLASFTGLKNVFNVYLGYFQSEQHRPVFIHGCTSITIPEGYIFLDSGQLSGLFEGIAGAAWYSELLKKNFPTRDSADSSKIYNTMLAVAHVVIIALIIIGNLVDFWKTRNVR